MDSDLFREVQMGLRSRSRREWCRMSKEIPDVSESWLYQVASGKYKSSPTHQRLQSVALYLRSHPVESVAA